MKVSPLAGKPVDPALLVNAPKLVTAYYTETSDSSIPPQRVSFGTSGHRGSACNTIFVFIFAMYGDIQKPTFRYRVQLGNSHGNWSNNFIHDSRCHDEAVEEVNSH
jgi:hypothetical protein